MKNKAQCYENTLLWSTAAVAAPSTPSCLRKKILLGSFRFPLYLCAWVCDCSSTLCVSVCRRCACECVIDCGRCVWVRLHGTVNIAKSYHWRSEFSWNWKKYSCTPQISQWTSQYTVFHQISSLQFLWRAIVRGIGLPDLRDGRSLYRRIPKKTFKRDYYSPWFFIYLQICKFLQIQSVCRTTQFGNWIAWHFWNP